MGEKIADLALGHLARMTLMVEEDITTYPVCVSLFGANAVMFPPDNIPDLVEQFGFAWGNRRG